MLVHGSSLFPPPPPPFEAEMLDPAFFRPPVLSLRPPIPLLLDGLSATGAAVDMPAITSPVDFELPATPGALEKVVFQVSSAAWETGLADADVPCCTWLFAAG
jgi:hypothetical protein